MANISFHISGAKHVDYYVSVVFSPRRGHFERSTKVLVMSPNMGSMRTGSTTVLV
jgi:hypothetical protein